MSHPHTIRWTVGRKLALGFGITLAFLAAVAGFGLYGMSTIDSRLAQIVQVNNEGARLTVAMRASVYQVSNLSRNIVLLGDDLLQLRAEQEKLKVARDSYEAAEQALAALLAVGATTEQAALFERIGALKEQVRPLNIRVIELAAKGETVDATSLLMTRVAGPQAEWLNLLTELVALEDRHTDQEAAAARAAYASIRLRMLLLAGLALLAAGAFAWLIGRDLTRQLGGEPAYAAEVARQIASGNLAVGVSLRQGDRGSLLHAMSSMRSALLQVVGSIRAGADSIATGSGQIAVGNADLSQRTEEQAGNLQQTAASMGQLTTSVQHNADTARQAAQLAVHASRCAHDGSQAVRQVQGAMAGIESASASIGEIIGVIDGIAFQTNILALNAAVEAARAGEQGRGFAVVAGEVRSLAQRSGEAARQVKQLIVDSSRKVAAGSGHVAAAARTMDEILSSVKRVNDLMGDIDAGSAEQSRGIGQVSQAVAQLDQVTQQNAALVEQSAAAAESLRHQADALVRSVAVFRLDDGAA